MLLGDTMFRYRCLLLVMTFGLALPGCATSRGRCLSNASLVDSVPAILREVPGTPVRLPNVPLGEDHWDDTDYDDNYGGRSDLVSITAQEFVKSCQGELSNWEAGITPLDKYWSIWNDTPAPWCSEFVGWNLRNVGLMAGETMPSRPSCARAYYEFYSEHPELAEIHENDGTYVPKSGDIVLFDQFKHTEMVESVDEDGTHWSGIAGGRRIKRTHRSLSDPRCRWFIKLIR
jgi:hypothetical protein